ncbi:hypothetical protein HDC36_003420 [Xanthomonas sp. JAI131]|uniref:hypothetical protein n=1 Tax=Xanthomonas sp. JAI131 TaxID=2723067 RepID=UPI0015C94C41|nr:hypothetical protein [Xanthomonas sp. JAI131]NYF21944.1 hypothetical protein [Xanthomonas sp. JAI131]
MDAYTQPRGKPHVHLVVGGGGLKVTDQAGAEKFGDLPWKTDLDWIRERSEVTVSRLAELFGVTRKAFYGWVEGANPRKGGSQVRIAALRAVLATLPSDLHRTAFFGLVDVNFTGDASFREVFQGPVDDASYQDRLNAKLAEINPEIESTVKRLHRASPSSRAFESEYPSA